MQKYPPPTVHAPDGFSQLMKPSLQAQVTPHPLKQVFPAEHRVLLSSHADVFV